MKEIIIAGGGTAGWLTSLLARKFYPNYRITLIESEDIGILGAGEGTVPHFVTVLDLLEIPMSEVMRECNATLKLGIRFVDWLDIGYSFFHAFNSAEGLNPKTSMDNWYKNILYMYQLSKGLPPDDLELQNLLSEKHKVPFVYENNLTPNDPMNSLRAYSNKALHFDARMLAKYLRKIAESRGVTRIEGMIRGEKLNELGNIDSIEMDNGRSIRCDFVFDCTGFARSILKEKDQWISYSKHLPMDSAIPFFIKHDNDVAPETTAIAMRNGWIWQIPVQGRYGCGYVYDSSYANEEKIVEEINVLFGEVDLGAKRFKFDPGTFRSTYLRNCMRVGLSQSFVEPLEATSIWAACVNLIQFLRSNGVNNKSNVFRKRFNADCLKRNSDIMDFIYMHYLSKRSDSLFWKEFRQKNIMPDSVSEKLELIKMNPTSNMFEQELFPDASWFVVASGMGLTSSETYNKILNEIGVQHLEELRTLLILNQNRIVNSCLTHKEFIEYMRSS